MGVRDRLERVAAWFGFGVEEDDYYEDEEERHDYGKDRYTGNRYAGDGPTSEPGPTVRRLGRSERSAGAPAGRPRPAGPADKGERGGPRELQRRPGPRRPVQTPAARDPQPPAGRRGVEPQDGGLLRRPDLRPRRADTDRCEPGLPTYPAQRRGLGRRAQAARRTGLLQPAVDFEARRHHRGGQDRRLARRPALGLGRL